MACFLCLTCFCLFFACFQHVLSARAPPQAGRGGRVARAGWAGSGLPGGKARGESGKREKKKTAAPPPAPKSPNPSLPAGPLRLLRGGRLHTPRASFKGWGLVVPKPEP